MTDDPGGATLTETDAAVIVRRVESAADAIATTTRGQVPVTGSQRVAALALALDLHATAGRHGVTRADLDGVVDLAGAAMHAIRARDGRRAYRQARQSTRQVPRHEHSAGPQL